MPFIRGNINRIVAAIAALAAVGAMALAVFWNLRPVAPGSAAEAGVFEVKSGESFREIADGLKQGGLIKSGTAFKFLALVTGAARKLKPGIYKLSQSMTGREILDELVSGSRREVTVRIPEGASVYDVDRVLSDAGVIGQGTLLAVSKSEGIEGRLFPDTYRFFMGSEAKDVVGKILENFTAKTSGILPSDQDKLHADLALASIVQNEVPDSEDQRIVAGILKKRLKARMPLQVDASICYLKEAAAYPGVSRCYPLTPLDFKIDSPYNTYLYAGLPPGPIGNPGVSAIKAAINQEVTAYWYYLSDPRTKRTIFAKDLEEQSKNRKIYLGI